MIADALNNMFSATSLDPVNPRDPRIVDMLGLGRDSVAGVQVDEKKVLGLPAVLRACNILGNAVAKVRPLIYQRTGEGRERDTDHPNWNRVTRRANQNMSAGQFRKTLTAHAMLWGNGLGYIFRNGDQSVDEMLPLLPDRSGVMVIRPEGQGDVSDGLNKGDRLMYWTILGGKTFTMAPEDVIHITGLSFNGFWGMPVVEMLKDTFGVAMAAREFGGRFFGQGANASVVIYMPPGLEESQQDDFKKSIAKGYSGIGKSHKAMILEEGSKVEKLTIPPNDAQFLATREFEDRQISLATGVKSHKLGDTTRTSYNSLEQSNQEHLDDDIDPWLQVWEDELEAKCLTQRQQEEDTHFIEFNRKMLVRTNLQAQTDRERFEREWGLATANEQRKRNNLNPIGPVGDTYLVPQNMHVLADDGMPVIAAAEPEVPADDSRAEREYRELALNRCERFVDHALAVAKGKSKSGKDFLQFLDDLPGWDKEPSSAAHLMEAATLFLVEQLAVYTEPPHGASELQANILAAVPKLREEALDIIRRQLEQRK